jgi:hypothetical protein
VIALKALEVIKSEVGAQNISISTGYNVTQLPETRSIPFYLWTSGPQEAVLQVAHQSINAVAAEDLKGSSGKASGRAYRYKLLVRDRVIS